MERFTVSISLNRPLVVRLANELPFRRFRRSRFADGRFFAIATSSSWVVQKRTAALNTELRSNQNLVHQ